MLSGKQLVQPAEEVKDNDSHNAISSRILERITECLLAAVAVQPEAVASYIPHFLPLYTEIVLSMDVARMHAMRSQTRILIVRFLARVLSCHVYKQRLLGWEDQIGRGLVPLQPCSRLTMQKSAVLCSSQSPLLMLKPY